MKKKRKIIGGNEEGGNKEGKSKRKEGVVKEEVEKGGRVWEKRG